MPRNVAQWTGIVVTMIIVLGRDQDMFTAAPLGICAGILASLFAMAVREPEVAQGAAAAIATLPRSKRHAKIAGPPP